MTHQSDYMHPPAAFRIQPFWFWNGEMDDREIERQITEMADKGLGGFFICPRQGLQIPYLSESWFGKVRYAVDLAARHGLEVWLYDEYPYPSGIAGGEVLLRHPDAKHKLLEHRSASVTGNGSVELDLPWGNVLYAKAVPVCPGTGQKEWQSAVDIAEYIGNVQVEQVFQKTGLTAYNNKRFFTYNPQKRLCWQAPADSREWELLIFIEEEVKDFKYYGTFVDPLHKEAMATFIDLTHQKYAEALGDRMADTVKGMFTDEIGLLGHIPWSPVIAGYMQEQYGIDLHAELPSLLYDTGEAAPALRYRFFQSVHELLRDHYHLQVHDWCEQRGLRYIAEVPSVRMSTQRYSHIPGLDSAHEKLGRTLEWILDRYAQSFRYNPKMMTSLARQLDRERVLVECFHSVGWSMTLQDAKWMIDRLAALGVNMYNFHAFYYTADGLTKHDAPPSQFLQNPYWQHFKLLGDYTGRLAALMSQGRMLTELAVLHPTATIWSHMGNPFHEFRYCGEDEAEAARLERIKEDWHAICKLLTRGQRDYDHLDTEILCEARVDEGRIVTGQAAYSVLIIPPVTALEPEAWEAIRRFADGGGTVIAIGLLPYQQLDGIGNVEEAAAAWFGADGYSRGTYWNHTAKGEGPVRVSGRSTGKGRACFIQTGSGILDGAVEAELLRIIEQAAPAQFRLESAGIPVDHAFLIQHRELNENEELLFISNQEGGSHSTALVYQGELCAEGETLCAELLDLTAGHAHTLNIADKEDPGIAVSLAFAPYESHAVRIFRRPAGQTSPVAEITQPRAVLTLDCLADWGLEALSENMLRLGEFALSVNGEPAGRVSVQAKTFIDQAADLAERGERLPIRLSQEFGIPMELQLSYPARLSYEREFVVEQVPQVCKLLMERGAIAGGYTIYINGHALRQEQFSAEFYYDYLNQTCDILPYILTGRNLLQVEVEINRDWEGLVSPLYLAGDFGVEGSVLPETGHTKQRITAKPASGKVWGAAQAGYPYFAGVLSLRQNLNLKQAPPEEEFELAFDNWDPEFHDCMEVMVNGTSLGVCAWSPYRWSGSSSILRAGDNRVEVRITNTLIGMLEGKQFDYAGHRLYDI